MTTVRQKDGVQSAVVDLSVVANSDSHFRFRTPETTRNTSRIEDIERSQCQADLVDGAIAAVQSGVFFAARRAGVTGVDVTIQEMHGCIGDNGFTGFAIAASLEVLSLCAPGVQLDEKSLEGWSIEES